MLWKYGNDPYKDKCVRGEIEPEKYVLFECEKYEIDRNIWEGNWERQMQIN